MARHDRRDDFAVILRRESPVYLQIERAACALSTDPAILARVPRIDAELKRRAATVRA